MSYILKTLNQVCDMILYYAFLFNADISSVGPLEKYLREI